MGSHIVKGELIYNNDIINLVLQNIDYGSVWKNIRSVSKNIYYLSIKYQRSKLIELGNPILSLMYIYPEKKWNLWYLLYEDVITIDFIKLTYNRIPWNKRLISMSSNITISDIINSNPYSIDWKEISRNSSIKVSDMLIYDYLSWDYEYISENTSIRVKDVRNNPNKNWNFDKLAINGSLSIEDLSIIMNLTKSNRWLRNKNTTYEDIIKYVNNDSYIFIVIEYITLNEDILQECINRHPDIRAFDINKQSITPNITKNNPQLNWDFAKINYSKFTIEEVINIPVTNKLSIERILKHPDFTIEDFFKYFNIKTFKDWRLLSKSHWVTFDIVLEYKDIIPWDHEGLSRNPNVTVDILEDSNFSWIRWDYKWLSRYAQLNWIYIIEHSDIDWDSTIMSRNMNLFDIDWDSTMMSRNMNLFVK